jgi:tRNA(fMet)-specific endonuclease VapC
VKYLLDTNAVSALMRGDEAVVNRLESVPPADVALAQPVLAELSYGIERLPQSRKKDRLRQSFLLVTGEIATLPWTNEVSASFGRIKAALEARGARIEDMDCAIAAHAVAHGLTLVTANRAHLARVQGLVIEDWSR